MPRKTKPKGNPSLMRHDGERMDEWFGRVSGFGIKGKDKAMDLEFICDPVADVEAAEFWRGDDIAKRVIELPVKEMYREGFEYKSDDTDISAKVSKALAAIDMVPAFKRAKMFERAYGGAAIFPVLNDGQKKLDLPLNEDRISQLKHLLVLEPRELMVVSYYNDITDLKFGLPKIYRLNPIAPGGTTASSTVEIHESRLIIWRGTHVTRRFVNGTFPGWGDSVLTLMKSALRGYNLTWNAISTLIVDFAQAVIKIKNLARLVAEGGIDEIKARMLAIEYSRSIVNATMIDADEEYSRETTSVSGLPELSDRVMSRLAAAANMPITLMMGQSPKGLGNEGDSDVHWWNNQISGLQIDDTPQIERMCELVMWSNDGPTKGNEPEDWSIEWRPLSNPSEKETADARFVQSQTDEKYIINGVVSSEDIATSRFGGDKYSFETTIDWAARDKAQAQMEKALAARAAAPPVPGQPGATPVPGAPGAAPAKVPTGVAPAKATPPADGAPSSAKADAAESIFFKRQLEQIDPGPRQSGSWQDMLRKIDGEWYVYNEAGTKRLAGPMSEAAARERLRQIDAAVAAKSAGKAPAKGK